MSFEETQSLVQLGLRLEAERLVAMVSLLVDAPGAGDRLTRASMDLEQVLSGLERRGVALPTHVVAARYGLSGPQYAVLTLATLQLVDAERYAELMALVEADDAVPTVELACVIASPEDPDAFGRELLACPLVVERLVRIEVRDEGEILLPHPALLELMGLS